MTAMIDAGIRGAIDALLGEIAAAWQAGDAARMAEAFAEDAVFVAFNGTRLEGRAAIREFHRPPFATVLRGTTLEIETVDIRPLSDGLYLVSTRGGPAWPGQPATAETQTRLCRNRGGRWDTVFFQNTPVLRMEGR